MGVKIKKDNVSLSIFGEGPGGGLKIPRSLGTSEKE